MTAPPNLRLSITLPGGTWILGPHRVICGDATDPGKQVVTGGSADEVPAKADKSAPRTRGRRPTSRTFV